LASLLIPTQLDDLQDYPSAVQHDLAFSFTLMMSMGIVVSILVGWLIDEIGLEACTALTLLLGQLQMVLVILFGKYHSLLVASFWVYTMFRQFLYPVYIASLTSHLGFKYFGVLLGVAFAVAGFAQLLLAALVEAVQGDCHTLETLTDECDHGHWTLLHWFQFFILGALLIVPIQDYRHKVLRESKIREILSEQPTSCSYGTNLR
jgi:MFS family permease